MSNSAKLGDIANISSGGTPSRSNPKYWNGNIPWVKTTQIQNCAITPNDVDEWITDEGLRNSSARLVLKGSLLIAMYGQGKTRGQVAILGFDAAINQACAAIQLKQGVDLNFIYHQLLHKYSEIRRLSNSGSQENLNASLIRGIRLYLPNTEKQFSISKLLDTWDKGIEKSEALIKAKEIQYEWLAHSLISENCPHWKHYLAKELFINISSKGHPDEELLSVTQDRGVIPRTMLKGRVMSPAGSTAGYKLVEKGNFVISLRSFQGGLEYSAHRGIVSPAYTILAAKKEISTDFYRHFFKSYIFVQKYLSVAVVGIRDGKQINSKDFDTVKIPYPVLDEQVAIAKKLDTAQQEIELLKITLEKYRLQKRGLMQKLLTGEWQAPSQSNEEILKEVKT